MRAETIAKAVVLTAILAMLAAAYHAYGQIGVNGAGFFENRTEQSNQWYHELFDGQDWVLRVPGGAIAKFADPTVSRGWGLTYDGIDSIQPAYGNPEEEAQENALQKWRRKADAQPDISYLPELVAFCQEFGCKVIWVANIFIPTNKAVYPVQYLLDNGVEVVAVELGNETYSQVDHDFGQFCPNLRGLLHGANPMDFLFHTLLRQREAVQGKTIRSGTALCNHIAQATTLLFTGITMGESFQA